MQKASIRVHSEQAREYDQQVRDYKWFGHNVLFGMGFEYVNTNDLMLDIGIGTGLASQAFAEIGLKIFGIDGSVEMVNLCKAKDFAEEVKLFDLESSPLPYSDDSFNHAVSCGVLQFFGDLKPLFQEVSRVIKKDGIFVFTTLYLEGDVDCLEGASYGTPTFAHSDMYIGKIAQDCGFDILKELKFLAWSGHGDDDFLCKAYVIQKCND